MIRFRTSRPGDVPRLRELWRAVFGDGEDFLDLFFSTLYAPERALVGGEAGRVSTMLFLLPMTFVDGAGGRWKMPYVYALATDPVCRGAGHAKRLLAYADEVVRAGGGAGVCTVPAQPSLHKFFASAGYEEGIYTCRKALSPDALAGAEEMESGEYEKARRAALAGRAYLDLPEELIAFQKGICKLSGADVYRLSTGEPAVVEWAEGAPVWKDCFSPAGTRMEEFGMLKWFDRRESGRAYLGLAFD